jgi:PTS system nitrogen regulatory IIA component
MKLCEYIDRERVILSLVSLDKKSVIKEMVDFLSQKGAVADASAAYLALLEREELGSTGIGEAIAIPHTKLADAEKTEILLAFSKEGISFDSVDGSDVKVFFLLLAPEQQINLHLKTLSKISRLVKTTNFIERVLKADTIEAVCAVLVEEEAKLS